MFNEHKSNANGLLHELWTSIRISTTTLVFQSICRPNNSAQTVLLITEKLVDKTIYLLVLSFVTYVSLLIYYLGTKYNKLKKIDSKS